MKGNTMRIKLATSCFVIGTLLAAVGAHAGDADAGRVHSVTFVRYSIISTKVKGKLAAEKVSGLTHIRVDADNKGAVLLSGEAKSQIEADKAVSITRATEGVTSVTSIIQIRKEMNRLIVQNINPARPDASNA